MTTDTRTGPNLLPVIIGIVITIILLTGLAYISKMRQNVPTSAPQLTLIAPLRNAVLDSPLVLRFTSARPISLGHSGWASANYHLHARVNGVEYMPAAADVEARNGEYLWTLPTVPRGPLRIRLGWGDQAHRAVTSGATDTIPAILR
jgi:hypothetical protein